jgi:uncharacterized protein YpmB
MRKLIKKIVINTLAIAVLVFLALVIFVFNSNNPSSFQEENGLDSNITTSNFAGPTSSPSGIKGPSEPPPNIQN